jgi:hypothetical protein
MEEARIQAVDRHVLLCLGQISSSDMFDTIKSNFYGTVLTDSSALNQIAPETTVYVCGDVSVMETFPGTFKVIKQLSYNADAIQSSSGDKVKFINVGQVPLNVSGMGMFFRQYFSQEKDDPRGYFDRVQVAHQFQILTESSKQSAAFRKGIYLSNVEETENGGVAYNLLRCSTNLGGPTDNFRDVDRTIVQGVNDAANMVFDNPAVCNHVLAQVYQNQSACPSTGAKERRARISRHSDKTKDMPTNGLIAFCSFYSDDLSEKGKPAHDDPFDYRYKNASVLTKLCFKLKDCITDETRHLEPEFSVTLYPNSLFLIPLSTNRLYTHEIVPPNLSVDRIPTRLGYVVRCSKTRAVYSNNDGTTYIFDADCQQQRKLEKPTEADIAWLKDMYFKENTTQTPMVYGDVYFSMNDGDYRMPIV